MYNKFNVLKFALAAGIYGAIIFALSTMAAIAGISGFVELSQLLSGFYGAWGYSVTWTGVIVGAVWGFIECFVHFGIFAWLYNKLLGSQN